MRRASCLSMDRRAWLFAGMLSLISLLAAVGRSAEEKANDKAAPPAQQPQNQNGNKAVLQKQEYKLPEKIGELFQDRKYDEALKALDEALAVKDAQRDYLLYHRGRALHLLQKYDDAIKVFADIETTFKTSPWARRARLSRAVSYARKGDFKAAEEIYKTEAKTLLSLERKQEIAGIYLEFADAFFSPKDPVATKPNYAKALEFYKQALAIGGLPESVENIELRLARSMQKLDQHDNAIAAYRAYLEKHKLIKPYAKVTAEQKQRDIEARFYLGEVLLAKGDTNEARRTWQDLLAFHDDEKHELLPQAQYNLSATWHLPAPQSNEDLSLGVASLERFLKQHPDHKLAADAYLRIAQSYLHMNRAADAIKVLDRFLAEARFNGKDQQAEGRHLLGRAYLSQKKFVEALATWREYLSKHPSHSAWAEVQQGIIDAEFLRAEDALVNKKYDEARKLWQEFLVKYPLDSRSARIMFAFGQMEFAEKKFEDAIASWKKVAAKYPGTAEASQAQFMIAVTYEHKLGKLDKALDEYKLVKDGPALNSARQALGRLTAKQLQIGTERIFRSNEKPVITLQSRNLESLTIRCYRIDLETYFRKMHQVAGIESLDIALIDPDKTIEYKVPNYVEYQLLENKVDVPLPALMGRAEKNPETGAMAVTVSSKTLEATTLVLQSDLDIIVKSSRDELLVFAQNMRTGKPWPGAKLLLSNGNAVFGEGTTGEDGVFKKSFKELRETNEIRVYAAADGHAASNIVNLNGIGTARGLSDSVFLYTDRPAYRAGQVVHIRGVIRRAENDEYTLDLKKKYTLEVLDPRNRNIWTEEISLTKFGGLRGMFTLPATSPSGNYRVLVRETTGGGSFSASFLVQDYTLEPIQLSVETPRRVYYRGEEITGKITAKYYYGAPLINKEVRYQLADGRSETVKTNEKGEIEFKFPTREFRETQQLNLSVTLVERNLTISEKFFLSAQGFVLSVSTKRPVYIAGESFEASISAKDPEAKPLKQKLTLLLLKQTVAAGRVGETEVEKHEVTTDDKGIVRHTFKPTDGGTYIIRVEGTDRFDNTISGQHAVTISDDQDLVRLRILAEQYTWQVGETAKVQIHWREEPALALVTFQGAKILDYKLVTLKKGLNNLDIPLSAKLAPNFELALSVMHDSQPIPVAIQAADIGKAAVDPGDLEKAAPLPIVRYHEAAAGFVVERKLTVKIETVRKKDAQGPLRPGEEVELVIKTTDALGKPVAAELSVAMIEQSLFTMFGNGGEIQNAFMGNWRESAMRSGSSISFAYRPRTRKIDKQLLAEVERREIENEEEARRAAGIPFGTVVEEALAAVDPAVEIIVDSGDLLPPVNALGSGSGSGGQFGAGQNDQAPVQQQLAMNQTYDAPDFFVNEYAERELALNYSNDPNAQKMFLQQRQAQRGGEGMVGALSRGYGQAAMGRNGNGTLTLGSNSAVSGQPQATNGKFRLEAGTNRGPADFYNRIAGPYDPSQQANGPATVNPEGLSYAANPDSFVDLTGSFEPTFSNLDPTRQQSDRQAFVNNGGTLLIESNGTNLFNSINTGRRDMVVVNPSNGEQWNLNFRNTLGDKLDVYACASLGRELMAGGNLLVNQVGNQETGYWNPLVNTDDRGEAKLKLTMPDQSTAWKILTRGVTEDTLAGQAEETLVVKQDLFGELKLPSAFTDGDEIEVPVLVHNDLLDQGEIEVTLRTIIGGKLLEETKKLKVEKRGIQELGFKLTIQRPTSDAAPEKKDGKKDDKDDKTPTDPMANVIAVFELAVKADKVDDLVRRVVPVLPYGVPVYAVQAGTATGDTTVWIEPPVGMPVQHPQLQVVIGSSVQRSLLDILLAPTLSCGLESLRAASSLDVTTSDLMAAIALQKLFDKTRDAGTVQAQALDTRIRSAMSQLIAAQRDDGGWSWSGHAPQAHRFTTARVYWALTLATKAGYKIADDVLAKAKGYIQGQLAALPENDFEARAVLLHALSVAGQGDYALANRLHRNKASLSPAALVYTALAFAEMDRKPVANELLSGWNNEAALVDLPTRRGELRGILPWCASGIELRALQALALSKITPEDPKLKQQVDFLLANRRGHRWAPEKATGPAALVVCDWFARAKFETEKYALKIFVNDLLVKEVTIEKDAETLTVDVPDRLLKAGKNRVNLQLNGRANYAFQAILSGYVPADKLVNTTKEWDVRRVYTPAVMEFDGREIPRGFDVLTGTYTTFTNPLTELPVGKRGVVTLSVPRYNVPSNTPEDQLDYLVITEPLPSGVSVVESSIKGGFERYELGAGSITFFVGSRRYVEEIRYEVHGYLPGKYRAAPTVVRNAYRLDDMAAATPKPLTVLALGASSKDQYKLTPREQYELGKRNYDKRAFKEAIPHLTDLFKLNLNSDIYKQTVQMLFESHLKLGPAGDIVRYFEIIKERFPEQEIPFDKIMLVAAAYDKLGEYERSYMVYRAILENSFLRENSVAGYLEQQGEFLRSVEVMQRLLAEYPPEPYAAAVHYALAQRVYAKAATALNDPKLREKKINRVTLTQQALGMLDNFLTLNPEDPAADQAAFSLANALLELKAYRELITRSTKYAARYPQSDFLDSYWYLVAYGHFALAEHEEALKMARKVADTKRLDPMTGRETESPNKWQAVYILGQVYHSLGRAGEAVAEYLRVEDRFADAKEAIAYFLHKEIKLPEVTTLRPKDPAKVELTFRNIPSVDFKVYRIDLMKFSLLKRNLGGITQINLAGIRPSHEETIKLGDGKDYRDRKQNLTLNIKEEGAYLVVVRGESLHASGLVLISPLTVEVAEECGAGRVRVTVKDVVADKYLAQVQAKVIGSRNGEFVSGMSDLRGVFIADGIKGKSTVIAQADDGRYAFFRGTDELGPPEPAANQPAAPQSKTPSPSNKGGMGDGSVQEGKDGVLIEQLQRGNKMLQQKQQEMLDNNYKNNNEGVRARSAF
jgi:uncharacterized protein YfaS (alpha-2-macroglobulin family)/tetratricopeptide (TPR) repeat protein